MHRFKPRYVDPKALDSDDVDLPANQVVLEDDPNEFARIENGELVFPMTDWNYRMIVLSL